MGGPHTGAEEEGAAKICDELTAISIPHPGYATGGEEIREFGNEVEPEKRGWGLDVLRFGFISHYPILI